MDSLEFNLSFYAYSIAATLTILIGLLYATRRQIMPYHLKALETSWESIDPKYQFMLRMLLNGGGFYGLSSGFFMLALLLIPFKEGQLWAGYALGIVGLVGSLPLGLIVYKVKKNTNGNPPLWIMIVINLLLILGLICCSLI